MAKEYNLSILCPIHGPMVDIQKQSHFISVYLSSIDPFATNLISWFHIASGIKEVVYDSSAHNDDYLYCESVLDYENEKSKFHSKLIKQLTIFNFIWGGFESILDHYTIPKCPYQTGKINDLIYLLTHNEEKITSPLYYKEVVDLLIELIKLNPWYGTKPHLKKWASGLSEGINIVYKIRNIFAHGGYKINFRFSEAAEWSTIKPYDIQIINASSKIVLLTLQMILRIINEETSIRVYDYKLEDNDNEILSSAFLSNLHLKK